MHTHKKDSQLVETAIEAFWTLEVQFCLQGLSSSCKQMRSAPSGRCREQGPQRWPGKRLAQLRALESLKVHMSSGFIWVWSSSGKDMSVNMVVARNYAMAHVFVAL